MSKTNTPTHRIFAVTQGADSEKADWFEIGAAWLHKDGKGFNLKLKALPAAGAELVMRTVQPKSKAPGEQPADTFEAEAAKEAA